MLLIMNAFVGSLFPLQEKITLLHNPNLDCMLADKEDWIPLPMIEKKKEKKKKKYASCRSAGQNNCNSSSPPTPLVRPTCDQASTS